MGFVGILGLSARFTGGGKLLAAFGAGRSWNTLYDCPDSCALPLPSTSESCESGVGIPLSLFGGTGATRGDFWPTMPSVTGLVIEDCSVFCALAVRGGFGRDFGESTVTRGGDRGSESAVVDTGRWSNREFGRLGRGTDGPGVLMHCGTEVLSDVDHCEAGLGISKETLVIV